MIGYTKRYQRNLLITNCRLFNAKPMMVFNTVFLFQIPTSLSVAVFPWSAGLPLWERTWDSAVSQYQYLRNIDSKSPPRLQRLRCITYWTSLQQETIIFSQKPMISLNRPHIRTLTQRPLNGILTRLFNSLVNSIPVHRQYQQSQSKLPTHWLWQLNFKAPVGRYYPRYALGEFFNEMAIWRG